MLAGGQTAAAAASVTMLLTLKPGAICLCALLHLQDAKSSSCCSCISAQYLKFSISQITFDFSTVCHHFIVRTGKAARAPAAAAVSVLTSYFRTVGTAYQQKTMGFICNLQGHVGYITSLTLSPSRKELIDCFPHLNCTMLAGGEAAAAAAVSVLLSCFQQHLNMLLFTMLLLAHPHCLTRSLPSRLQEATLNC